MQVKKIKVGYLEANCYIVEHDNSCIVIDPGDDPYLIEKQLKDKTVLAILITHGHKDHIGAVDYISKIYSIPIYSYSNLNEKKYELGNMKFEVIKTPGHTKDSICFNFYEYNFMFTGDFIFKETIGRTDLEGGNQDEMNSSIIKISKYPKLTKLYPGHGDSTTLDYELENNYFLKKILK